MKHFILIALCVLLVAPGYAQNRHWVFFTDKASTSFDPYTYFDSKAIERRAKHGLSLYDSTDFPVSSNYLEQLSPYVEEVRTQSRWLNAVSVEATTEQLQIVENLPFVKRTKPIRLQTLPVENQEDIEGLDDYEEGLLKKQLAVMQAFKFHENGIDGSGIRIAIFDGGFPGADEHPALQHIFDDDRVIATYDFTRNDEFVYKYNSHGTMVWSCIAGVIDGEPMGLATGADFLLARTEVTLEPYSEEENWLAAVEWADRHGADVINSSLGYINQRYFVQDMDGETSLVAHAANMAAHKGIIVVNSMGNSGSDRWKIVGTPADADSVLSIGGISPETQLHIGFSSYGPTADGRLKPNVSAYGTAVVAEPDGGYRTASGTSFSSPLVAGFVACAYQLKNDLTNMELFREIEKSGHLYPYYDYAHGYGIPQAGYFTDDNIPEPAPTFDILAADNQIAVQIKDEYLTTHSRNYLFYHIAEKDGKIDKYGVVDVFEKEPLVLESVLYTGKILKVYYLGYTTSFTIE